MFGYLATGRSHHEGGGGRDIKQIGFIAAGANYIDQPLSRDLYPGCQFAHHFHRAGNLVDGFTFHSQGHQEAADLGLARLTSHYLAHHIAHLRRAEVLAIDH